jgi:UDPglucose--hexose-1-phosphate uridylyltransferase
MKNENKIKKTSHSELRQDIVTGDWVVIATGRAKRPEDFSKNGKGEEIGNNVDTEDCLFCDPEASGQGKDVLIYRRPDGDWSLRVFPNKFPAFSQEGDLKKRGEGPYLSMDGTGYHEVIATRDHFRHIPLLEEQEIAEILDAYQDRYLDLMNRPGVDYIGIFHNYGKEVGASITHPHSQLMAIPVVSPYVELELQGAERYNKSNKECIYCLMAEYEREHKKRVVF